MRRARRAGSGRGPHAGRHVLLREHTLYPQHVRDTVVHRIEAPDEAVAVEDREHEVAELALRLRDVDLQAEPEAEQLLGAGPVVDQSVERRQQDRPASERAIEDLAMRPSLSREPVHGHADGSPLPLELPQCPLPPRGSFAREGPPEPVDLGDAEGPQLHVEETPGLLSRARPGFVEREAPRREIPDPLLAGPARDHDLSLGPQHLEHHRGVPAVVVPPTGPPADRGAILERPGGQGALVAQPLQDVPPEPRVLAEVPADVRVPPAAGTRVAPHRLPMHGELRGREDERPVLEQRPIPPQEPLELLDPEPSAEP